MPVLFDSSASNLVNQINGTATSGSVTGTQIINPAAQNVVELYALYLMGNNDTSAATLSATYGGDSLTQIGITRFNSNKDALALFAKSGPQTGSKSVVGSVSGLTGHADGFWLMGASAAYSGVLGVGSPVTAGGSTATANSVTVSSVAPAHRVITVHAVRSPNLFSAYNQTQRSIATGSYTYTYTQYFLGFWPIGTGLAVGQAGEILLGDAPGNTSIVGTATQPSTAQWGSIGVALTPAPVTCSVGVDIQTSTSASARISRNQPPDPKRTWVIK